MNNQLSIDQTGHLIWGLSCLFTAGCLISFDGCYKKDIRIISGLWITFLFIQFMTSTLFIVNDNNSTPSDTLLYITLCIFTFGGNIFLALSSILFLSPLHKNQLMRYFIILVLPVIYLSFVVVLFFIGRDDPQNEQFEKIQASYLYYIPCTLCIFMVIIIQCIWYKKEKFIFAIYNHSYANLANDQQQSIHSMANWSLLFKLAVISVTIALVFNFAYPAVIIYFDELIPDKNPGFTVRCINSLIVIPSITPLFRSLDKVLEYSMYRVFQNKIMDASMLNQNAKRKRKKKKKKRQILSDPSDLEQEPLRE